MTTAQYSIIEMEMNMTAVREMKPHMQQKLLELVREHEELVERKGRLSAKILDLVHRQSNIYGYEAMADTILSLPPITYEHRTDQSSFAVLMDLLHEYGIAGAYNHLFRIFENRARSSA